MSSSESDSSVSSTSSSASSASTTTEEWFEAEKVLQKRNGLFNKIEYLVKWKNFGHEDNTWELGDNLGDFREMVNEFERNWKKPRKIVGTTVTDKGERAFIMEWEGPFPVTTIIREEANAAYPDIVINYYQSRYNWR